MKLLSFPTHDLSGFLRVDRGSGATYTGWHISLQRRLD